MTVPSAMDGFSHLRKAWIKQRQAKNSTAVYSAAPAAPEINAEVSSSTSPEKRPGNGMSADVVLDRSSGSSTPSDPTIAAVSALSPGNTTTKNTERHNYRASATASHEPGEDTTSFTTNLREAFWGLVSSSADRLVAVVRGPVPAPALGKKYSGLSS
eukprot:GSA120T00015236001.1